MIFLSILILIVAVALPSIIQNISKNLYVRISSIIFICAGALALTAFYIQSIGSGIGIYSGLFQVPAILLNYYHSFDVFNLSGSTILILKKIILFLTWFVIGTYTYLNLLSPKYKNIINNLSFFECLIIFFLFFLSIQLLAIIIESFFPLQQSDLPFYHSIIGNTDVSGSPTPSKGNTLNRVGDAAIMGTAVTVAGKIAQQCPNPAAKAAFLAGGVAVGGAAIVVKNIAGKISDQFNKFAFYITKIYDGIYNLSGNDAIDLLNLIQVFQKLEILFLFLIFYNLFVLYINEVRLEFYLDKVFPTKLVKFYIKSLKVLKKSSLVIVFGSLILLLISSLYAHYYLQFFIDNLDKIVEIYLKK